MLQDAPGLVGRVAALAAVRSAAGAAAAGRGSLVLVAGEAGIGKTALLSDAFRQAGAGGAIALWGQCWDGEGAPAYWPWVQVLRGAIAAGGEPGASQWLLPERTPSAGAGQDRVARFGLFDAVATMLGRLAEVRPLLVVLDDLHWADDDSLQLLDFCARHSTTRRMLLLGGYRDDEATARLRDFATRYQQVSLAGLAQADVAELMTAATGERPAPPAVRDVWHRTGGNPFLVLELTRLLAAQGGPRAGPSPRQVLDRVRDIVERRLARLSQPCIDLLTILAVFGQEVGPGLLRALAGHGVDASALVDEAVKARVLVGTPAGFRFSHDLFRETIVDTLPADTRSSVHLTVARALEAMHERGTQVPPAQLAAHFAAAGNAVNERAVHYSRLAAEDATARLAFDEAAEWCQRAVAAFERGAAPDAAARLELLFGLAEARNRAGRAKPALEAYRQAAELARTSGDGDALARAGIGVHSLGWRRRHAESIALLEEAAAVVPGPTPGRRARVLACLARALHHSVVEQDWERSAQLADEAVVIARDLGDPETYAFCLLAQHDSQWRPGTADQRLPVVDEMLAAALAAGDQALQAHARLLRATALIELSHPGGVLELDASCRLYEVLGHPRARYNALSRRATLALLAGRSDDAHDLAVRASSVGRLIGEPDTDGVRETLLWSVTRLTGHLVHEAARPAAADDPWPDMPILAAALHAARGELDEARHLLAQVDTGHLPRGHDLEILSFLADAVAVAGERTQQERLYELLSPYAGSHVVIGGCASYGGAVDHALGTLARSLGRLGAARRHFEDAAALHARLGVPAWQARSDAAAAACGVTTGRPLGTFRRDGAVWSIGLNGQQAHLPDAKGMHDLAALVARPGVTVHAVELHTGRPQESGSDVVLDDTAKTAYRRRLVELDAEIDAAAAAHDSHRADRAQRERDALIATLRSAVGLGGRDRRLGDASERARKAVTARIRDAIGRIELVVPELGRHLQQSVQTGTRCTYEPAEPVEWNL